MRVLLRYYLPVVLWGLIIAVFSSDAFSGNITLQVLRWLFEILGIEVSRQTLLQLNAVARKLAHITEYFVFTVLVWRAARKEFSRVWDLPSAALTLVVVTALAAADEANQLWLLKLRTGSFVDVAIDTLGAGLALAMIWRWTHGNSAGATGGDSSKK